MSPERLMDSYYGWEVKKSDVFSIGCIFFELLAGERLFSNTSDNHEKIFTKTLKQKYNKKFNLLDDETKTFLLLLIEPRSKKRICVKEALNHKYKHQFF